MYPTCGDAIRYCGILRIPAGLLREYIGERLDKIRLC